ncbi:hypothetical protein OQX63_10075 [Pedobacter sp. PF22-3]|uniref:hypothetical protein n=1 Tax=Pedobacter sp. PF22-3 TaxID=2994467 RepID=UPI002246EA0B|nr:hypothetical protein [Pedobacter sp. PF22-3]MCX2493820.1 hypothetical protein [Pedobacter sp. PF22-3]
MKKIITFIIFLSLVISKLAYSQATIDFSTITYDPDFFNNSGCPTYHRFGPNPISVNGYNIRTVGSTSYTWNAPKDLSLYAWGNTETGQRCNAIVAVDYPFIANKTYIVELYGMNDHNWNNWVVPKDHYNGVFWIKLDSSPEITTNVANKCKESLSPVERTVGRYSKLVADRSIAFEMKTYSVKFSPLENKSSVKIIFDSSPIDPKVIIDNIFRLKTIKITEIPYEEESGRYNSTYLNVPFPPRGTPGYDIPIILDNPSNQPGRLVASVTANPNQWSQNNSSTGYSIKLSQLIQNLKITELVNISLMTDRPVRGNSGSPNLPCTYLDNYYSITYASDDAVINFTNPTNTAPSADINFNITYNNP